MRNLLRRARPQKPWAMALALLLLCAVMYCGYRYLISDAFQGQLQTRLVTYLENAMGASVRLDGFRFDPLRGQARLKGLAIAQSDNLSLPFLEIGEAVIGFSLRSPFAERQIELRSVHLNSPRLHIQRLADARDNLPRPRKPGRTNFVETVFRAAVRHVEIHQGLVILNAASVPLDMTMTNLQTLMELDNVSMRYKGHLEFQESDISVRSWKGRHLSLRTDFGFYSQGLEFYAGSIQYASTEVSFSGLLANLYAPDLLLDFQTSSAAEDLQQSLGKELNIRGVFHAKGQLSWRQGRLSVTGNFSSPALTYFQLAPRELTGQFHLDAAGVKLSALSFDLLDGHGQGDLSLEWSEEGVSGRGDFRAQHLGVRKGLIAFIGWDLPLAAHLEVDARLEWSPEKGSFQASAQTQVLKEDAGVVSSEKQNTTLLRPSGRISLRYSLGQFQFDSASLSIGGASLTASGWMALDRTAALDFTYSNTDVEETASHVAALSGINRNDLDPWLSCLRASRLHFEGRYSGTAAGVPLEGKLVAQNPVITSTEWDLMQTQVVLGWDRLVLQDLQLTGGKGVLGGTLSATLTNSGGRAAGHLEIQGSARDVPLPLVAQLGGINSSVSGLVQGSFQASGRVPDLEGRANLQILQPRLWGEAFDELRAELRLANTRLLVPDFRASRGTKELQGSGWYSFKDRGYQVALLGSRWDLGNLLSRWKAAGDLLGLLSFRIEGLGSIDNPSLTGSWRADSAAWKTQPLNELAGEFRFSDRLLQAQAQSDFLGGKVALSAQANWGASVPSFSADFRITSADPFRLGDLPAQKTYGKISAGISGKASLSGPLEDPNRWQASLNLSTIALRIGKLEFHATQAVEPRYAEDRIHFDPVVFADDTNRFTLSGDLILQPQLKLDLKLTSVLDLSLLNAWLQTVRCDGKATLAVNLQGEAASPKIFGSCRLETGNVNLKNLSYALTGVEGLIYFNENIARVINVRGTLSSGGTVTLDGSVNIENLALRNFMLLGKLDQVLLRIPQGFRTVSNASLVLRGDLKSQLLLGEVNVEEATYSRNVDLLTQLSTPSPPPTAGPEEPLLGSLSLDVVVNFNNGINISTETVRLTADGRLRVLGPSANPSLLGRISADSGDITFLGNHYEITKGGVEFVNPLRIEPHFDLAAQTTIKGYRINLLLRGTPDNIQPDLRSEPPLPVLDLITLLSTGVTSQELMGDPAKGRSSPGVAASNILATGLSRQVESRVQRVLGFRQFKIDPFLAGRSNNPTARVTLERRLTNNLSITYSTDITTSQSQVVLVEYFITPKYSLIASRDENGKMGLDLRIQKKF